MAEARRAHDRAALATTLFGDAALAPRLAAALAHAGATARFTHGFHTYPAGMHPDAARDLVALFPGETCFDPFCGGGTTLVEARAAGRRAFGADLSPIAVRVARVRCATPDDATLT